jgi:hypothetical protein
VFIGFYLTLAQLVFIFRQGREGRRLGQTAMPNNPSIEQGAFDPEATAAMGEAFEAACEELHCTTQPEGVRELAGLIVHSQAGASLTRFAYGWWRWRDSRYVVPAAEPLRPPPQSRK